MLVPDINLAKLEVGVFLIVLAAPFHTGFDDIHSDITAVFIQVCHQRQSFSSDTRTNVQHCFIRSEMGELDIITQELLTILDELPITYWPIKHELQGRDTFGSWPEPFERVIRILQ